MSDVTVSGTIKTIRYYDAEQGFAIITAVTEDHPEAVALLGQIPQPVVGQPFTASGVWKDSSWGKQIAVSAYEAKLPVGHDALATFLGSGLLKGVGKAIAKRIIAKFGDDTLHVIEKEPDRLIEVKGITTAGAQKIQTSWKKHEERKELLLFLANYGIHLTHAGAIFSEYGSDSVRVLKENPYILATDISGIGFKTADRIAKSLGIAPTSPYRLSAGIIYALETDESAGHTCTPRADLLASAGNLLEVSDTSLLENELGTLISDMKVSVSPVNGVESIFLPHLYNAEDWGANFLRAIARDQSPIQFDPRIIDGASAKFGLTGKQRDALVAAFASKVSVMTGGPGVGKTTTIRAILLAVQKSGRTISLCAPTGRAAKRMSEVCGHDASTIHRLLEYNPKMGGFARNRSNPIESNFIVVDEMSMVDVRLFFSLVSAIRPDTHLVLVGDSDQLPSVGPGTVLADIIASGICPVTRLDIVHRQAATSRITRAAHNVRKGLSVFSDVEGTVEDARLITIAETAEARNHLRKYILDLSPAERYDLQVITPMNKGSLGTTELNTFIQEFILPPAQLAGGLTVGKRRFCLGDRVMQTRNNYDRGVFNGTIGTVISIDLEDKSLTIDFDGEFNDYDVTDLGEIVHAYAITIHKSQGSEFPRVILLLANEHYIMLQRTLVYTAMTRAKSDLTIIASDYALNQSIRNALVSTRRTSLRERLSKSEVPVF